MASGDTNEHQATIKCYHATFKMASGDVNDPSDLTQNTRRRGTKVCTSVDVDSALDTREEEERDHNVKKY